MLDQCGQLLRAAVGFAGCSLPSHDRALHELRSWLDSWSGIGHVTVGMARQGYDLQLTRYDKKGWRATFYRARRGSRRPGGQSTRSSGIKTPDFTETVHLRRRSGRGRLHGRHTLLVQV